MVNLYPRLLPRALLGLGLNVRGKQLGTRGKFPCNMPAAQYLQDVREARILLHEGPSRDGQSLVRRDRGSRVGMTWEDAIR